MQLLAEAVRRGKEVLAVLELKARFDEEANINSAEKLEALGAQVVYGVLGLKTHAKMLLITRREKRSGQLKRYGHLSDRKSTRLNSSHLVISYAVFCLKKKNIMIDYQWSRMLHNYSHINIE